MDPPSAGSSKLGGDNGQIWLNSIDALSAGGGDPMVRVGVLRLLSTLPDLTVRNTTTDGQRTLTLLLRPVQIAGNGEQFVLIINVDTRIPIEYIEGIAGQAPDNATTYQMSRVSAADIAASRF